MKVESLDLSPAISSVGSSSLLSHPKNLVIITHQSPVTRFSLSPDSVKLCGEFWPHSVKYRSIGKFSVSILRCLSYRRSADPFPSHFLRLLLPPFSLRDYLVLKSNVGLNFPTFSASFSVAVTSVRPFGTFDIGFQWHRNVPLLSAKFSNESIAALITAHSRAFGLGVVTLRPFSGFRLSANLWRVSQHFDMFLQALHTWHCTNGLHIDAALDWHVSAQGFGRAVFTYRAFQIGLDVTAQHFRQVVPRVGVAWTGSAGQMVGATLVLEPPLRLAMRVGISKGGIGDVDVRAAVKLNPLKSLTPQWSSGIDWSSESQPEVSVCKSKFSDTRRGLRIWPLFMVQPVNRGAASTALRVGQKVVIHRCLRKS
jgi:hypothetical protein